MTESTELEAFKRKRDGYKVNGTKKGTKPILE